MSACRRLITAQPALATACGVAGPEASPRRAGESDRENKRASFQGGQSRLRQAARRRTQGVGSAAPCLGSTCLLWVAAGVEGGDSGVQQLDAEGLAEVQQRVYGRAGHRARRPGGARGGRGRGDVGRRRACLRGGWLELLGWSCLPSTLKAVCRTHTAKRFVDDECSSASESCPSHLLSLC